ncbi:hypothetical protein [Brevundimonas sp.]|uniref:hypothetical protein n=1 Tax=Brevundimonas sp. TaxID=1871086 RepID=UPI00260605A1|nr:hypothetical protein [Brevundimonas sp.]
MRKDLIQTFGMGLAVLAVAGCTASPAPTENTDAEVSTPAAAPAVAARPVLMGVDEPLDACGGYARVKAGRTLIVRSAPDAAAAEIDRMEGGTGFFMCDGDDTKPDWLGVAYETEERGDCSAVSSPAAPRTPVPATCASGWVMMSNDVEMVAG